MEFSVYFDLHAGFNEFYTSFKSDFAFLDGYSSDDASNILGKNSFYGELYGRSYSLSFFTANPDSFLVSNTDCTAFSAVDVGDFSYKVYADIINESESRDEDIAYFIYYLCNNKYVSSMIYMKLLEIPALLRTSENVLYVSQKYFNGFDANQIINREVMLID